VKRAPFPSSDSTVTCPSWAATSDLTIASRFGPAFPAVRLTESIEYQRKKSGRDADPGIFHLDPDFALGVVQPDRHASARA
jgi:hypothetical protein